MSKKTIRYLFIFFLIYLPVQYAAVGIIGQLRSEPWPSMVFPGFKNVYDRGEDVRLNQPVLYFRGDDQSEYQSIPFSVLLDGIPVSHHRAMLRYQFLRYNIDEQTRTKYLSPEAINWLNGQLEKGGYDSFSEGNLKITWYHETYRVGQSEMHLIDAVPFDSVLISPITERYDR